MSFSAGWLTLREPADRAARDAGLRRAACGFLAPGDVVLDLGCGTGATRRAMAGEAPAGLRWRMVDRDPALLALAAREGGEAVEADLVGLAALPFEGVRLLTASALVDLAGADWVAALAARVADVGAGVYATLCYDGVMAWAPALGADDAVRAAFNRHQRRDKGLMGPALGPDGAGALAAALAARGYDVRVAPSPWRLGAGALAEALAEGVAAAAAEAGEPGAAAWGQARRAESAVSGCVVGHVDVLALPPSTQSKTTSESSA